MVDLSDDSGSKSNIVFTHLHKEPKAAPFHLEIVSATAHRKFLFEELTRIGSMTYTDHELVHELNQDLNEVSRRLRTLYKQQQQHQDQQQQQPQQASTHLTPPVKGPSMSALSKLVVNTPDDSTSSSVGYDDYEEPSYIVK